MAQQVQTIMVDDLDGTEGTADDIETMRFGLDGSEYEIDLTAQHAKELRAALARPIEVGRRVQPHVSARASAGSRMSGAARAKENASGYSKDEMARARAWLMARPDTGVKSRGRISPDKLASVPRGVIDGTAPETTTAEPAGSLFAADAAPLVETAAPDVTATATADGGAVVIPFAADGETDAPKTTRARRAPKTTTADGTTASKTPKTTGRKTAAPKT